MRRRMLLAAAGAAAVVFVAGCGDSPSGQPPASSTTLLSSTPSGTTAGSSQRADASTASSPATRQTSGDTPGKIPDKAQKATVARIVDGDTLELAAVAAGPVLASTVQVDVRLLEIDTPETKHPSKSVQCFGAEATARLTELAPPGSTVWVQRDEEIRDQYGRYLLYLWNSDGVFVNRALVQEGYAQAALYQPNDRYWDTISQAEIDAQAADAGAWGACPYFGAPDNISQTTPEPTPSGGGGAYLFPPPPPDKDCDDTTAAGFRVRPGDPHRFDADGDGIGCEG